MQPKIFSVFYQKPWTQCDALYVTHVTFFLVAYKWTHSLWEKDLSQDMSRTRTFIWKWHVTLTWACPKRGSIAICDTSQDERKRIGLRTNEKEHVSDLTQKKHVTELTQINRSHYYCNKNFKFFFELFVFSSEKVLNNLILKMLF